MNQYYHYFSPNRSQSFLITTNLPSVMNSRTSFCYKLWERGTKEKTWKCWSHEQYGTVPNTAHMSRSKSEGKWSEGKWWTDKIEFSAILLHMVKSGTWKSSTSLWRRVARSVQKKSIAYGFYPQKALRHHLWTSAKAERQLSSRLAHEVKGRKRSPQKRYTHTTRWWASCSERTALARGLLYFTSMSNPSGYRRLE